MTVDAILRLLIEDIREVVEPNDPEGMHKANCPEGDGCSTCHMMRVLRPMLDEAEFELSRAELGVSA